MSTVTKNLTKEEVATAREMLKYEDKWVAIAKSRNREKVVAYGDRITDAKAAADKAGVKNPTFRKIPSARQVLIAMGLR